ncbi:MAG: ABC transporter substrate-binding protein [Chloroflexota bacterium]
MSSLMFLAACGAWSDSPPDTVLLSPTPVIVEKTIIETIVLELPEVEERPLTKDLVVCLSKEPDTLYRHGRLSRDALAVLQAVYENDITRLNYGYQAQGLVKLPNLADGDAWIEEVVVGEGERVVNAEGSVVSLVPGELVQTADGKTAVFDGAPLVMRQISAEFTLKPRFWADGEPVTAADSVYSYNLAVQTGALPVRSQALRTARYEAIADQTVRWTGLPGYRDAQYATRFWSPLPQHIWAEYNMADIPTSEMAARLPVGDGPFQIVAWEDGQFIRLEKNPYYYLSAEGFPYLDSVTFRFVPNADQIAAFLLNGGCHIATQDALQSGQLPFLLEADAVGLLDAEIVPGTVYEALNFGINSWNGYGDGQGRPDWFEDARVRQAVALCLNREAMAAELLNGRSPVMHSYLPASHPLYPPSLSQWSYDPAAANALLDAAGYKDANDDGYREDPRTGQIFRFTITTTDLYQINRRIAARVQEDLRQCQLVVDIETLSSEVWYAGGENSKLFGRHFDLGHLALPIGQEPLCTLFASWEITGPADSINPATGRDYTGWNGLNSTGWWDKTYDAACETAVSTWPDSPEYHHAHIQAQLNYAQNLPMLPLFPRLKFAAARPEVIGFHLDTTQESELWNLYKLDLDLPIP